MKIPVLNLYYLLCYAWNRLEERDVVGVTAIDSTELADLFAQVLLRGLAHLRRRGFDRGYIEFAHETPTLRGKLDFATTLRRNLFSRARAYCEYDRLSHDVLHNRIVKSTVEQLVRVQGLDSKLRDQLHETRAWFADVTPVALNNASFRRVQLHRNNAFYGFLIDVCQLVAQNLLVSEETGETLFRDFSREEGAMRRLFEEFVRNFLTHEQSDFNVKKKQVEWFGRALDKASERHLPKMETDIYLSSPERVIVIETKYSAKSFQRHFEKGTVRSEHLYQLFAYLQNIGHGAPDAPTPEGILLYPTVDTPLDLAYELSGHSVRVKTVNLNQDWPGIHADLLAMVA